MSIDNRYAVTVIDENGKATKRIEKRCPSDWSNMLIAIELSKYHTTTPFTNLLDVAQTHSVAMGYQRALCDEVCTVVVTELR